MTQTLSQLVKRHLPSDHAGILARALEQTPMPVGRIALHSMRTKEQVELVFDEKSDASAPYVKIGPDIPLDDLVIAWRDLEEENGILPTSWKATAQPRIKQGNYALFGVQNKDATTLFIIDKKREKELLEIPGLTKLPEFETYRTFTDERDDTDLVTGLRSRTYFDRKLSNLYRIGAQVDHVLLAGDLDQFKALNGRFGYAAGDLGLKIMGQEIIRSLGEDGIGSRRHYGDEIMLAALKELFDEHPEGALGWTRVLNDRLHKRSREHFGDFILKLTFGLYAFDATTSYEEAKRRADQALVYAKKNNLALQTWEPGLPTHEEMQSGRYGRMDDPKLAAFGAATARAFSPDILPEQAQPARDILEDIIHKSAPVRESANEEVFATLAHHLLIASPTAMKNYSEERVWEAIYLARKNLNLLTPQELDLTPDQIPDYLSERLNLKHLLKDDEHKDEYNNVLESFIHCRYDDSIRTITATTNSQHQSRFIISGRDTPTTGEATSFGELLNVLTTAHHFEDKRGLITFHRANSPDNGLTLYFDNEHIDYSPALALLADTRARIINYFGLTDVDISQDEASGPAPHYTFTTNKLEALEPLFRLADTKEKKTERKTPSRTRIFKISDKEYGASIPEVAQLLAERVKLDPTYAAELYHEPNPQKPWKDGSTSTRVTRRAITQESAARLIRERYAAQGVTTRGDLPIFYAPLEGMVQLLADLYIPRDIYLTSRAGELRVSGLRVPDLETNAPRFDEVVTYYARELNALLHETDRLHYTIERAQPRLTHTPKLIGLQQLAIPISARYGELFCK